MLRLLNIALTHPCDKHTRNQPTHLNLQNKFACKFLTENNESPPEYANINETNIWKFCINQGKWKET